MSAPHDAVVRATARALLAPSLVVAAALLVKGYADVGDGFAAGMVVSLAIALHYVAFGGEEAERVLPVLRRAPAMAVGGLLLALGSASFPLLRGEPLLTHHPVPGQPVVTLGALELFTPLVLDIAVAVLVVGVLTVVLHQFGLQGALHDAGDREEDR